MKKETLKVKEIEISLVRLGTEDYISLTDMVRDVEGDQLIKNWLRNKNTLEFLAAWEKLYNPNFNLVEFDQIRLEAGTNRFLMSVKQWVNRTGGIGIVSKTGRHGSGTYAHKDIAFEFGMWISPEFKLLLIKEYQLLKSADNQRQNLEWDVRRLISKTNYVIQTDSIKQFRLPELQLNKGAEQHIYSEEADILNLALFGKTAKQWREENSQEAKKGLNIRDLADIHELIVLANLETHNAKLIEQKIEQVERLKVLHQIAFRELQSLRSSSHTIAKIESPFKTIKSATE